MNRHKSGMAGFYTIPAGVNFAEAVAGTLLSECQGAPEALSRYMILLPTRRACRVLRDAFLRCSNGTPLLLPRMQPIGDIDEEELTLSTAGTALAHHLPAMPPAISPLRRQALLSRTIMAMDGYTSSADQAFALAQALGRLMDQIHTEGLDIRDMAHIVPDDFAAHWQITLDFLSILMTHWPDILAEQGVIDATDRRNRLIEILTAHWRDSPPDSPVIAAGSTGSIPATAALLKTVAALPQGRVVLPGLDQELDEQSWQALDETHPQATLHHLLTRLGIARDEVKIWPGAEYNSNHDRPEQGVRRRLATEIMRPAATTQHWTRLYGTFSTAEREKLSETLGKIRRFDCDTVQEEATLIALALRETLEEKGKTAALITPDRHLARRVATICRRWGLVLDDSGGCPLPATPAGSFLRLTLETCQTALSPAALSGLMKHALFRVALPQRERQRLIARLEEKALRGNRPPPGIDGLKSRLQEDGDARSLLSKIEAALTPLLTICDREEEQPFRTLLDAHIRAVEALSEKEGQADNETIWAGDDGEAAALFLTELRDLSAMMPNVTAGQYGTILQTMMAAVTVRPSYGTHPRLFILGQLEARLLQADLVIMGGLNEGTWPPDAGHDPWMSRPMRKNFGLPAPERSIGLAAHDFIQGFCAPHVIMTRARRADGSPAVPSRWLQRLDTVLQALDINPAKLSESPYLSCARALDRQEKTVPWPRPAPCPPRTVRPHSLYVTQIETWMRDPYSLYARKILGLRKLPPLDDSPDAAIRGTIVHDVLHRFIDDNRNNLPDDAQTQIIALGRDILAHESIPRESIEFWWPRFERLAGWFTEHEQTWRANGNRPLLTEGEGQMQLAGTNGHIYTVKAKADRIDKMPDGRLALVDYKTGSVPKTGEIKKGIAPQMTLEAAIAMDAQHGFTGVKGHNIGYIGFWNLSGGMTAGIEQSLEKNDPDILTALAEDAREGVLALFEAYDNDSTPYPSLPRPEYAPPAAYQDYAHLARVQEWADLDGQDGE